MNMKISTLLAMTILTSVCFAADSTSPQAAFYKGNSAYQQGKFEEAVAEYQKALDAGYESGNIYYNLSNTYFKKT